MLAKRAVLSAICIAQFGMFATEPAPAQPYPTKPISLIIPFTGGGPPEFAARFVADRLSSSFGQPVIIENRPGGAGGTVGAKAVAAAMPDGHTLLFSNPGPMVTAAVMYKNVGYDPAKSFAPVATIFSAPQMLVVNPSVPARSIAELVAYTKANPGKISFASPGFGTMPHMLGEMLKLAAGADIVHVPYKGSALAISDVMSGQLQMYFDGAAFLLPHIEAGKLRALAVAEDTRIPELPAVPTTIESGYPRLQASFWTGILAPAGTPANIVEKLNTTVNQILKAPEFETILAKLGAKAKIGSPQEFAAFMAAERVKWTEIISAAGITTE